MIQNKLIEQTQQEVWQYLSDTLGINAKIQVWTQGNSLPLAEKYAFYLMAAFQRDFLLLVCSDGLTPSAGALSKQRAWLDEHYNIQSIYVAPSIESYNRKRLIQHKIPFIVPGSQLYLPTLGIDLSEHFKRNTLTKNVLSTPAQMMALAYLLKRPDIDKWNAETLAAKLGLSKMSISRALLSLKENGLIEISQKGRRKIAHFILSGKDFWTKVMPLMPSPVFKKELYLENPPSEQLPLAGTSALSELTMLAEDKQKTIAIGQRQWKTIEGRNRLCADRESPFALEIWRYNPLVFSKDGMVDCLSLFLSLKDESDERIEQALNQMMERIDWT